MKKSILGVVVLLGGSVFFSVNALAAGSDANTNGIIEYGSGELVIDPDISEPTDPGNPTGPTTPIDPETGNPDPVQPGGNINSRLPQNLNFGYHVNQSRMKENWVAKNVDTTGLTTFPELSAAYNNATQTVGALMIEDNRTEEGSWEVKVKQSGYFKLASDPTATLGATKLSITPGTIWNNISATGITASTTAVDLTPGGAEVNILSASEGNGAGLTKLNLTKFELEVPKDIKKESATYSADINWTVSETP